MRKKIGVVVVSVLLLVAASTLIALNQRHDTLTEFEKENIDALATGECNFGASIWWVHRRSDGGMNCTKGGSETCL